MTETDLLCDAARMEHLLTAILTADGCPAEEAQAVAHHLVEANLAGHDSHGIIRITRYHSWLAEGRIHAGRPLRLIADLGAMLHFDGQDGMGQWLAQEATARGIERARAQGMALVALRRAGHIGRVGTYAEQACAAGLVSIHFVNVAGSRLVAPFGSAMRSISTAPVTVGVPNADGGDFILDFATSRVAEGKALVAARGGKPLPADALVDGAGAVTADPGVLYGDTLNGAVPDPRAGPGALRAMGGHKGSGLALACELLGGALTGNGTNGPGGHTFGNGMLSVLIDPARLDDLGMFAEEVTGYIAQIRSAPPAAGMGTVLTPGDPERARRADRLANGLPLPESVLEGIVAVARECGVAATIDSLRA